MRPPHPNRDVAPRYASIIVPNGINLAPDQLTSRCIGVAYFALGDNVKPPRATHTLPSLKMTLNVSDLGSLMIWPHQKTQCKLF